MGSVVCENQYYSASPFETAKITQDMPGASVKNSYRCRAPIHGAKNDVGLSFRTDSG